MSNEDSSPGARIRVRRDVLDMTQVRLAELATVTQPAISQIEHDAFIPRPVIRQMIADALRMRESDIWTDADLNREDAA